LNNVLGTIIQGVKIQMRENLASRPKKNLGALNIIEKLGGCGQDHVAEKKNSKKESICGVGADFRV